MDLNKIEELRNKAALQMNEGNFLEAHATAKEILSLGSDSIISFLVSGIYIDVGSATNNEDTVLEGLKILEADFKNIKKMNAAAAFYNRGNGYYSLFKIKRDDAPLFHLFKNTELDNAIKYYRMALTINIENKELLAQILINLGNCYDSCGRVIEALECYEEAISICPNHGMALGNKGIALSFFAEIMAEHEITFLVEAYNLILNAIKLGVHHESESAFIKKIEDIRRKIPDTAILEKPLKLPGYKINVENKVEKFLMKFCLKNRLYLNICNYCQKCDACIGDSVLIKNMIIPIEEDISNNAFLRLSSYLNQIKQDYISARFLLILSLYEKINYTFVDKYVRMIDTFEGNLYNINIQLLKFSFKSLYDILDKIANFLNDYLSLGVPERRVYFHRIWYSERDKLRNKIKTSKNPTLNALYKIHKDFDNEEYNKLKKIRNALTHRFVKIKNIQMKENAEEMTVKTLIDHTIKLAKIVRTVIIYVVYYVDIEERMKYDNTKTVSLTAKEIDDKDKYFRI